MPLVPQMIRIKPSLSDPRSPPLPLALSAHENRPILQDMLYTCCALAQAIIKLRERVSPPPPPPTNPTEMAANITKINIYGLKKMITQTRNYENLLEKKGRAHAISQMEK